MTKRQALHLPLLLPMMVLALLMIPAALICRLGFALLRYLERVYKPLGAL